MPRKSIVPQCFALAATTSLLSFDRFALPAPALYCVPCLALTPQLAAYGLIQADALAVFLTETTAHPIPERVFSSGFYRCLQTALPTARALGREVAVEHGVGEWYSPAIPGTGLHPRPSPVTALSTYFPPNSLDATYAPTLYPSRNGETMKGIQDRGDLFVSAWVKRVEELYPDVKSVAVFGHAASVIALGRALTGDKKLDILAGCASTSLYKRRTGPESDGGVGSWDAVYLGKADYLEGGLERDWSFRDAVVSGDEVVEDVGDQTPHPETDAHPEGLAPGMEKYVTRWPTKNEWSWEVLQSQAQAQGKGKM